MKLILVDFKTRPPIFNQGAIRDFLIRLERIRAALKQNPQFEIAYEFPTQEAADDAMKFLAENSLENLATVRVRQKP
jgi:filamentous hemagglutinin